MPEGKFPKKEDVKKKPELTQEEIEGNLKINTKSFATESEGEFLSKIKDKNWCNFIVDENFHIFFSLKTHEFLSTTLQVNLKDCLISGGSFQIDDRGELYFSFSRELSTNIPYICVSSQNKIKEFLKSKGVKCT